MMKKIKPQLDRSAICNLQFTVSNLQTSPRQGFVLILVVVVIALLTLVCFTFSELMLSERKAVIISGRQSQALAAAESGVQMARIFLLNTKDLQNQAGGWYDNPSLFCGALVVNDTSPTARLRCTIVAPLLENGIPTGIRFGLENESAKLNLNNILQASKSKKKSSSSGGSGSRQLWLRQLWLRQLWLRWFWLRWFWLGQFWLG